MFKRHSGKVIRTVMIGFIIVLTACNSNVDRQLKIKKQGIIRFNESKKIIGIFSVSSNLYNNNSYVSQEYINAFLVKYMSVFNKNEKGFKVVAVQEKIIESPYIKAVSQGQNFTKFKEYPRYELTELGKKENKNVIKELCKAAKVDAAMNIEFFVDRNDTYLYPIPNNYNAYITAQNKRFIIKTEIKDALHNDGFNYGSELNRDYWGRGYNPNCCMPDPLVANRTFFPLPENYKVEGGSNYGNENFTISALAYNFVVIQQNPYLAKTSDNDFYGAFSGLDIRKNKTFSYAFTISDNELEKLYSDVKNAEKYAIEVGNLSLNQISNDTDLILPKK